MSAPATTRSDPGEIPAAARPATTRPPHPSTWTCKVIMAVTGTIFGLFVFAHMLGNLKVFMGGHGSHFNEYAEWLRTAFTPVLPENTLLWALRIILLVCLVGHVWCAILIRSRGRKARGEFRRPGMQGMKTFQARNMLVTGLVLLFFLIFHLMDLTFGAQPVASDHFVAGDAYQNLIYSFERPAVAIFYILAMLVLFLHLEHGLWSVINDLGGTGRRLRAIWMAVGAILAGVVMIGNIAIPLSVMTGLVGL